MSNPYEPYQPPGGESPYGGQPPYGNDPYGAGYGGNPKPVPNDAVSIIGFVLSLTCCLSVVGAILGFVGLSRTKDGKRRARWAAIAASIIGPLGTIAAVGLTILIVYGINQVVTPDNAEVGQCIDVDDDDSDQISLTKAECGESHDAEIVAVAEARDFDGDLEGRVDTEAVCTGVMDPADVEKVTTFSAGGTELGYEVVIEDPDNVDPGDTFVCYVEPLSGSLDEPVL